MAICPKCGVENAPMNATCDVCKAPLGAGLVEASGTSGAPKSALVIALLVTAVSCTIAWIAKLHPTAILVAMFYGPLLGSYLARRPAVFLAAVGGLAGVALVIVMAIMMTWTESRAVLASLAGHAGRDDYDPDQVKSAAIVLGLFTLAITVAPVALTGAAVGEVLARARRDRLAAPTPVASL